MSQNLKNQLIKLGSKKPELQDNIRPILDRLTKTSSRSKVAFSWADAASNLSGREDAREILRATEEFLGGFVMGSYYDKVESVLDYSYHREGGGKFERPYTVFSGDKRALRRTEDGVAAFHYLRRGIEELVDVYDDASSSDVGGDLLYEAMGYLEDLKYELGGLPHVDPETKDGRRDIERNLDKYDDVEMQASHAYDNIQDLSKELYERRSSRISRDFDSWMKKVNRVISRKAFMDYRDLPDQPYRRWFNNGMSPKAAAMEALRYAGF